MLISDWSSDVGSSDLSHVAPSLQVSSTAGVYLPFLRGVGNNNGSLGNESSVATYIDDVYYTRLATAYLELGSIDRVEILNGPQGTRSEEHTSELQSLMRISYAVFCLKKKNTKYQISKSY